MWLTPATWLIVVGCKVLHFINNEDPEALGYKILPLPLPIPKYQPIVESSRQYPIELDIVVVFFYLLHKSPICD